MKRKQIPRLINLLHSHHDTASPAQKFPSLSLCIPPTQNPPNHTIPQPFLHSSSHLLNQTRQPYPKLLDPSISTTKPHSPCTRPFRRVEKPHPSRRFLPVTAS